jgi:hypothetical protein
MAIPDGRPYTSHCRLCFVSQICLHTCALRLALGLDRHDAARAYRDRPRCHPAKDAHAAAIEDERAWQEEAVG